MITIPEARMGKEEKVTGITGRALSNRKREVDNNGAGQGPEYSQLLGARCHDPGQTYRAWVLELVQAMAIALALVTNLANLLSWRRLKPKGRILGYLGLFFLPLDLVSRGGANEPCSLQLSGPHYKPNTPG